MGFEVELNYSFACRFGRSLGAALNRELSVSILQMPAYRLKQSVHSTRSHKRLFLMPANLDYNQQYRLSTKT